MNGKFHSASHRTDICRVLSDKTDVMYYQQTGYILQLENFQHLMEIFITNCAGIFRMDRHQHKLLEEKRIDVCINDSRVCTFLYKYRLYLLGLCSIL